MTNEKYIQFIANYDDWIAVKKLKIEEKTDPRTVMEFLAGLTFSIDRKVEENLGKIVDIKTLNKHLDEIEYGKKTNEIAQVLNFVNGSKTNKVINEITSGLSEKGFQNVEIKEIQSFCKTLVMRKALKRCSLNVDYSGIEIPDMKRLMKKNLKK